MPPKQAQVSPSPSQSEAELSQPESAHTPAAGKLAPRPSDTHDTLLPRLVTHLVAAKRSLAATALVQRADALVSAARQSIEDIAALSARNAYLRDYAARELRVLERIRAKLDGIRDKGSTEFKAVLRTLDASDVRVKKTLQVLKTTSVERSFQLPVVQSAAKPPAAQPANVSPTSSVADPASVSEPAVAEQTATIASEENATQKCLYDFVSEQGVEDLTRVFRECIDATNDAAADFARAIEEFDANITSIAGLLKSSTSPAAFHPGMSSAPIGGHTPGDDEKRPTLGEHGDPHRNSPPQEHIPALFRSLESNATEVADLLQSLVRHYDLCVTALKHTEGGGEAAAKAHAQVQIDMPSGIPELADTQIHHEPISDEEWAEMIQVLDKDALEVDDVVQDIRDHQSEMEDQLDAIQAKNTALKSDHSRLRKAVKSLEELGSKLTVYISAGSTFMDRWAVQKSNIQDKMEELEALRDFYEGFLGAYDGLILEIGRRKIVHAKMDKILSEAMAKVSKLHDDDAQERESFKVEHGEFLPADIWPGLVDPPAKFEVRRVDQDARALPEVSKEAMQRAMQRHNKR